MTIPFFVVDRPMSLKLLEYCEISKLSFKVGLMGHANTSYNFQIKFRKFKGDNIIKMADSGVFNKNGSAFSTEEYEKLFEVYERMGVHYGVIIDVLKDKDNTISSAKKAWEKYKKRKYSFELVAVAQGNDEDEYLECYSKLKEIGYRYIAIGGLLKKVENSSRYVRVRNEKLLESIVKHIRKYYKNDWLFLLGCYHPKRLKLFRQYKIFGSDYKGWILNYKPPSKEEKKSLTKNELRELRFNQIKNYLYQQVFSHFSNVVLNNRKKLIVLSCSKRKIKKSGKFPAFLLYDGVFFRQLRKYIDQIKKNVDIYILSAKYGLIKYDEKIEFYDQEMTKDIAYNMRPFNSVKLSYIIESDDYDTLIINLSENYQIALGEIKNNNKNITLIEVKGRIGERLRKMKKILTELCKQ